MFKIFHNFFFNHCVFLEKKHNSASLRFLQISALILLVTGFYWPVLNFLSGNNPLHPEENFLQWSFFKDFLSDSWNLRVIIFSLYQAFLSAALSIFFGFPGAWLLTHYNFPGKYWFRLLTYLPFFPALNSRSSGDGFVFWQQWLGQSCDDVITGNR
ncbi:MAG: hypothetical protein CM1200mP28_18300 [Deltaproteobacteria bacterium]|nr:MAG: hypothetical protein CM1200mP28_18300 [Deltaproteobacteria bacterium]